MIQHNTKIANYFFLFNNSKCTDFGYKNMKDKDIFAPFRKKLQKEKINIKEMGVNIDKNEYYEIAVSHTNHPEDTFRGKL